MNTFLRMVGVTKRFPGVVANEGVNLEIRAGEVHALLGENGAGKTTLMNILYGLYQADEGEVWLGGERVRIKEPADAIRRGVGMVHQHFMLVNALSVLENVMLGTESPWKLTSDTKGARARLQALSSQYGLHVDIDAQAGQLSVGERQRVEIIKALYRGARLLILDEPTAVLTPGETRDLFTTLRHVVAAGCTVILISHKLNEVMAVSDRITVLRRGKVVGTLNKVDTNPTELARMMVGRDVLLNLKKGPSNVGAPVLELQGVSALDNKGLPAVRDFSLTVRAGEIVGIAGVDGNGQSELAELVMGYRRLTGGQLAIDGQNTAGLSTRSRIRQGAACIPEDRNKDGLVAQMTIAENLVLHAHGQAPFSRWGFLDDAAINEHAQRQEKQYDIRCPGVQTQVGLLSGGNQQKVILARELDRGPKLLVAMHPTRGLDIGAIEFVRSQILKARSAGCGVLLISTELDEVFSLSDRIAVIYEGRVMGTMEADEADLETIGMMMTGSRAAAN